jgi:hypothetical protein
MLLLLWGRMVHNEQRFGHVCDWKRNSMLISIDPKETTTKEECSRSSSVSSTGQRKFSIRGRCFELDDFDTEDLE